MKKIVLSLLILTMGIMLFSPNVYAEGDPAFTVYAFDGTETTHNISGISASNQAPNYMVFIDGVLAFDPNLFVEYDYDCYLNFFEIGRNDYDNYLLMYNDGNDLVEFSNDNSIIWSDPSYIVIIVSDDLDSFNAWGFTPFTTTSTVTSLNSSLATIIRNGVVIYENETDDPLDDNTITFGGGNQLVEVYNSTIENVDIWYDDGTLEIITGATYVIIEAVEEEIPYQPGFTHYTYYASNTTHELAEDLDLSKVTIFYQGVKIFENGVELMPYVDDYTLAYPVFDGRVLQAPSPVINIQHWPSEEYISINLQTGSFENNLGGRLDILITEDPFYTVEIVNLSEAVVDEQYIEVEGLYQLSDIIELFIDDELFISNSILNTTFDNGLPTFDESLMSVVDGKIVYDHPTLGVIDLIWVTPGRLYIAGLALDETWGFASMFDPEDVMHIEVIHVYRVPGINGTSVFVTNVDNPITEGEISASIKAYDETDGDITDQIIKTLDEYTPNRFVVGEWDITYQVTDSSDNVVTFTVTVFVRDIEKPELTFEDSEIRLIGHVETSYTELIDLDTYHSNFTVTDNYDDSEDLIFTVTDDGGYVDNSAVPGTYYVVYRVEDTSGNYDVGDLIVTVIDDVAPIITGPDEITTAISSGLTLGTILMQYIAEDAIDENRTAWISVVSETFTANKGVAGEYEIIIQVDDESGNIAQKTISVVVTDDVIPVFYVTRAFISVAESITLTFDDIIRILYVTGQIDSIEGYSLVSSTYFGHELEAGIYQVSVTDGVQLVSLTINVDSLAPVFFAIQFNVQGGSFVQNLLISRGDLATRPNDPVREGYTFGGWYKDSLFVNPMNWDDEVTNDMMLYAKWIPTEAPVQSNLPIILMYVAIGLIVIGGFIAIRKKAR